MFLSSKKLVGMFKRGYLLIYLTLEVNRRFDVGALGSDGILFLASAEASCLYSAIKMVCRTLQTCFWQQLNAIQLK